MLESLEIRIAEPIENYKYEWISGVAHYAVDPDAPANARIADLGLAPRDHDGKVRFSGDVVLLRPADGGNGRAILSVPNRGMVRLPYSGSGIGPTGVRTPPSPGDGFLLDRGWTIALPGWQWDVPRRTRASPDSTRPSPMYGPAGCAATSASTPRRRSARSAT